MPFLSLSITLANTVHPTQAFSLRTSLQPSRLPQVTPAKCLSLWGTRLARQHAHSSLGQVSQPVMLGITPVHQHTCSSHGQALLVSGPEAKPTSLHTAITAKPQQDDTLQPTQEYPWRSWLWRPRRSVSPGPEDNFYTNLLFQNWEMWLINLIHRVR